jgi:hypothetical protein
VKIPLEEHEREKISFFIVKPKNFAHDEGKWGGGRGGEMVLLSVEKKLICLWLLHNNKVQRARVKKNTIKIEFMEGKWEDGSSLLLNKLLVKKPRSANELYSFFPPLL